MKQLFKRGNSRRVKMVLMGLTVASIVFTKAVAAAGVFAAPVTLKWDSSPNPTVAGYKVYYGIDTPLLVLTNTLNTGRNLSATLSGLVAGQKYFFYVVAYDNTGYESPPSNIVRFEPGTISQPSLYKQSNGSMQIKFRASVGTLCMVQYTSSLSSPNWQNLAVSLLPDANGMVTITDPLTTKPPMRFYRVQPML